MRSRVVVLGLVALGGCVVDEPGPRPLPEGDLAVFASLTQPVLDEACADAGCHGRADRPLALFSPGRRRADPTRTFLDEPLSAAELASNARAVAAFALDPLVDGEPLAACLVLRKPLALAAGGCGHEGGVIFDGRDDRGYRALLAFLATLTLPEAP